MRKLMHARRMLMRCFILCHSGQFVVASTEVAVAFAFDFRLLSLFKVLFQIH